MLSAVLIVGAYLLGAVPFGLLIGLAHGIDVRGAGSRNIGATNVGRVVGRKWGYLCLLLDILKGLVPTLSASLLLAGEPADPRRQLLVLAVALAAVLGHVFPVYLGFRGGKGVATTIGVALGVWPYYTAAMAVALMAYALARFATGLVSIGSLTLAVVFPAALLAGILVADRSLANHWPLQAVSILLGLTIIVRHRENIRRLLSGEEFRLAAGDRTHPKAAADRAREQVADGTEMDRGARDRIVVSLAAVAWDFGLVGRTRMLSEAWHELAQPTVFVQVPSYRTAVQRLLGPLRPAAPVPVVRPWPTLPARWWSRVGPEKVERAIRRRAAGLRRELNPHLSWDHAVALVVSPVWTPWLEELPFQHVIYDCIDELEVHVTRPELAGLYRAWEERLLKRASGVVVTAERLGDAIRARRPDLPIALIRNGVDVHRFQTLAANTPRPDDLPETGRPVVGFVGALYAWIDWELIRSAARELPELDFVLVGPHDRRGAVGCVAPLPNVYLLGPRPYDRVPAYINAFDVCWVPFKQDDVGKAANPVKIYEYLALGKPVVTTPVADTDSFGELVAVAGAPADMVAQLRAATADSASQVAARVEFAKQNTWKTRAQEYLRFISELDARPAATSATGAPSP